jgi:hypothetical protein
VGIVRPGTRRYAWRHNIYTGLGSQSSVPYVLFGVVLHPAPGCCFPEGLLMCSKVPDPPLYSLGGRCLVGYKVGVLVGLHDMSPNRITGEFEEEPTFLLPCRYPGCMPDRTALPKCTTTLC